jgi:putative transposase
VDRTAVHRFASTPPARIVPALADEGIYVASEAK